MKSKYLGSFSVIAVLLASCGSGGTSSNNGGTTAPYALGSINGHNVELSAPIFALNESSNTQVGTIAVLGMQAGESDIELNFSLSTVNLNSLKTVSSDQQLPTVSTAPISCVVNSITPSCVIYINGNGAAESTYNYNVSYMIPGWQSGTLSNPMVVQINNNISPVVDPNPAPVPTPTPSPTPTPQPVNLKMFVTGTMYNGNLGGIAGANAKCEAEARRVGLTENYVAFLQGGTPLNSTTGSIINGSGQVVISNANIAKINSDSVWTLAIESQIDYAPLPGTSLMPIPSNLELRPWTGISPNSDGFAATGWTTTSYNGAAGNCAGWTSDTQNTKGTAGAAANARSSSRFPAPNAITYPSANNEWSVWSSFSCSEQHSLYCVQQPN